MLTLLRAFLVVYGGVKASDRIHKKLLVNIMKAPLLFFHSNPVGRILNRFASDTSKMDELLPTSINGLLDAIFVIISVFVVISINSPLLLLTFPPIGTCACCL